MYEQEKSLMENLTVITWMAGLTESEAAAGSLGARTAVIAP